MSSHLPWASPSSLQTRWHPSHRSLKMERVQETNHELGVSNIALLLGLAGPQHLHLRTCLARYLGCFSLDTMMSSRPFSETS